MNKLIISIGTLTLDIVKLSSRDYRKLKTICTINPTNIGGSRIKMAVYPIKYDFNIEVNLTPTQKETLDLIISEHTRRISEKLANPEILLEDLNNPIIETVATASRNLANTTTLTTLPIGIKYFPMFKCGVTNYSIKKLAASYNCTISMDEL